MQKTLEKEMIELSRAFDIIYLLASSLKKTMKDSDKKYNNDI